MYNKLFTKILDSSIWMEATPTRIVWITLLAAMDEDGYASFASVQNLAHRAIVPIEETETAVKILESPDQISPDQEHEGRRIERVPGGWLILNAKKYRDMINRVLVREGTRLRVAKHRASKKELSEANTEADTYSEVTVGNNDVTEFSLHPNQTTDSKKDNHEFILPSWVPVEAWSGYEEMRKKIKKPLTDRARKLAITELEKLRIAGHPPERVLNQSVLNSWAGVFELKNGGKNASLDAEDDYAYTKKLLEKS